MSDENKSLMTTNQYALEYSREVLQAVFNGIEEERQKLGKDFATGLEMTMLASFICNMLYQKLKHDSTEFTTEDYKCKSYQEYKSLIQQSVSLGFQCAFQQFDGKSIDYYCQVNPIPEPINKTPC